MSPKKIGRIACAVLTISCVGTANATMLFSDDFDNDNAGSYVLNFNGWMNWNVINGTVDYLKQYPGISCLAGGCVDLDGLTGQAGRMISKQSFVLNANTVYRLSATFSGAQRSGYGTDNIKWGITNSTGTVDWVYGSLSDIAWNTPFNTLPSQFSGIGGTFYLFVEDPGSRDNVGPILDSISFQSVESSVPEPAALILVGLGLTALGLIRRRHL